MGAQILNELTGEAILTDDADRKYHLVFDLSAVMQLEAMSGHTALDVIRNPSVSDCVVMIMAGIDGHQRRNGGGKKISAKLAQRILADSGGFRRLAPVLVESLSCAEGLGLGGDDDDGDGDEDGPFPSPT